LEISKDVLMLGDRYLLQYYLGSTAVAVYSAGYNAATLATSLLIGPLRLAVVPMYLETWHREGGEATSRLLGQALKHYAALAIPLALGFSWYRTEIISLLASAKYAEAATIVPYIVFPLLFHGGYAVYAAGLYIQKRTVFLMSSMLVAAGVNVALNVLLIPRFQLFGAALATLVAYVLLAVWAYFSARRHVRVPLHPWFMAKVAVLALAAIGGTAWLGGRQGILVKIPVVILLYGGLMLAFDRDARSAVLAARAFLARRSSRDA
jgi:O-antigen/teichoic acid export membrane protein